MNYVIIGNSAAAIGTIEGIRQVDKTGKITVISDEKYHTYSRPLISYWLMGKVTDRNIYYRGADFYEKNGVETMLDTRVTKIDAAAKNVVLSDGNTVPYDKLMVATGSKPFVPPMNGMDKIASCHTFMSYDSVKAIKAEVKPGMKVLIRPSKAPIEPYIHGLPSMAQTSSIRYRVRWLSQQSTTTSYPDIMSVAFRGVSPDGNKSNCVADDIADSRCLAASVFGQPRSLSP